MRHAFSRMSPLLLIAVWTACSPAPERSTEELPNIVLFYADDLGYGDLASYGHPTIRTPNLDGMAAQGIRLTSFYNAASSCTPARAALLTGRYPQRVGLPTVLVPEAEHGLSQEEITLAKALKGNGYRTAAFGKWHLGHARPEFLPTAHGFDEYFGLLYSNDMMPPWVQTEKPLRLYRGNEAVEYPVDQTTLTVRYTEEAIQFIQASRDEPFFLYLAYSMPHVPIYAPEPFRGRSRAGLYGDVIESIDWSAGEILQTLSALDLEERTLVVFTSDNGPWLNMPARMFQLDVTPPHEPVRPWHAGSAGLLRSGKATSYEGGFRVPCIIRWPGHIPAGQVSADLTTTMDLFVTLLTAAEATVPRDRPIDGSDLLSFLKGEAPSPTRELCYFVGRRLEAVRSERWKLRLEDPDLPELYDLEVDPSERYNRSVELPDVVLSLRERFEFCRQEISTH